MNIRLWFVHDLFRKAIHAHLMNYGEQDSFMRCSWEQFMHTWWIMVNRTHSSWEFTKCSWKQFMHIWRFMVNRVQVHESSPRDHQLIQRELPWWTFHERSMNVHELFMNVQHSSWHHELHFAWVRSMENASWKATIQYPPTKVFCLCKESYLAWWTGTCIQCTVAFLPKRCKIRVLSFLEERVVERFLHKHNKYAMYTYSFLFVFMPTW